MDYTESSEIRALSPTIGPPSDPALLYALVQAPRELLSRLRMDIGFYTWIRFWSLLHASYGNHVLGLMRNICDSSDAIPKLDNF